MIIWGRKTRQTVLSSGRFHCPRCNTERTYKHKRVANYFTLYFIPLFKTEDLDEYIECQTCLQGYKPEVLNYKPLSPGERMLLGTRQELETGTPVHMVRGKLVNAGLTEEDADNLVNAAMGTAQSTCPACGFVYLATVKHCSNCGSPLKALEESA